MRTIKQVFLAVILVGLVFLAIANRDMVTVELLPAGLSYLLPGMQVTLPLFIIILAAVLLGLLIGYLLEYLREHKYRRVAKKKRQEADQLDRDIKRLRRETNRPEDDVLAIVES